MNTNWNTKEEYLQFVQDWKRNYKALSESIRLDRSTFRIALSQRSGGKRYAHISPEDLAARAAKSAELSIELKKELGAFWNPSAKATELLEIRKEQKVRAGLAREERIKQQAQEV